MDLRVLGRSGEAPLTADDVSPVTPWTWTDSAGLTVHGFLHPPRRAGVAGPEGELPPLVVEVHGGPTSRTEASFSTARHFWTTRGFAVLDVNYSGSTGHGRAYRDRLLGQWGEVDIDDCVTGALSLADAGLVDRDRLAIRGGSAGGYAVLRAMTTSRAFAAGTSLFGVADLAALAAETHKFESRYCDRMVAPWPAGEAVYRERSPLYDVDRLHGEVLLLQGEDDRVVPLAQAEGMAAAMRAAGREVRSRRVPRRGPRLPAGDLHRRRAYRARLLPARARARRALAVGAPRPACRVAELAAPQVGSALVLDVRQGAAQEPGEPLGSEAHLLAPSPDTAGARRTSTSTTSGRTVRFHRPTLTASRTTHAQNGSECSA